jgi:hypothetical protein
MTQLLLAYGYLAVVLVMTLWDVLIAGRIANIRRTPRSFQAATAFGGLLIIPALLVSYASSSIMFGRAIYDVRWIWPLTAVLFVVQATYALTRKLVTSLFGIPILIYNILIATVALARFMISRGEVPPDFALAVSAAQVSMQGFFFGPIALSAVNYPMVPLFSPSLPARWRASASVRAALAISATILTALVLIDIPNAIAAIRSYDRYAGQKLQEHPEGDFQIGLRIFPNLRSGPPTVALRNDFGIIDSLDLDVISVVITPEGARLSALDSLAHSLEDIRTDSTRLIAALSLPENSREPFRKSPGAFTAARVADINRIARALRPTYLLPIDEAYGAASVSIGVQPVTYWKDYISRAAQVVHHVNPNIRVVYSAASFGTRDSSLYSWAASRLSPVDVVGFSLMPGFDGAISLDTHMRVAQRWMGQFPDKPKEHWVFAAGGFPQAHGERSQELALWGALAWATSQSQIRGLIVNGAGDYDHLTGVRDAGGRLRPVYNTIIRAQRGLAASASPQGGQ